MGEEAALWGGGAMLSGTGLSGSDKDDKVSNRLDTSKEAVVSNKDNNRFNIDFFYPALLLSIFKILTTRFVLSCLIHPSIHPFIQIS